MSKIGEKELNKSELYNLFSRFSFDFVFLERVDEIRIERFKFDNKKDIFVLKDSSESSVFDWDKGIAFSKEYELRWEKNGNDEFHAIFITDNNAKIPSSWNVRDISGFEKCAYEVFLWGRYDRDADCWIEGRIPRFLHYPLNPNSSPSPKLKVNEYYRVFWEDDMVKEERFYRFMEMF